MDIVYVAAHAIEYANALFSTALLRLDFRFDFFLSLLFSEEKEVLLAVRVFLLMSEF